MSAMQQAADPRRPSNGKYLRGSANAAQEVVHMVSAFHSDRSLVLGQEV